MIKVTPDEVKDRIARTQYHQFPNTNLTVCCLTLDNGFNVTGESNCLNNKEFNESIGQQIAYDRAFEKAFQAEVNRRLDLKLIADLM